MKSTKVLYEYSCNVCKVKTFTDYKSNKLVILPCCHICGEDEHMKLNKEHSIQLEGELK